LVQFKVDTGANVTVIPEKYYSENQDGSLSLPKKTLSGLTQQKLRVQDQFLVKLQRGDKATKQCVCDTRPK